MHHGRLDKKTAQGLVELRNRLASQILPVPSSALDETLNLATWNVREFGRKRRLKQSLHYVAEIMNEFDIIAITELRDKLEDLQQVMSYLGPYWKVVFSDFNADRRGNRERIGYLYDERAVTFTGLAAEPDPPRRRDRASGESIPRVTWWRSPFMASFRAGNFDFILLAAHIRWDSTGGVSSRARELKMLADWVEARRRQDGVYDKDLIVLGDFNVPKLDNVTFEALTSRGLKIPNALTHNVQSNLARNKRYDQILHYPGHTNAFTNQGGVLDFYKGNHSRLFPGRTMTKRQFTYQLSDHLPLWIQVNTDNDDEALDQLLNR